jgi:hypothetical protein
MNAKIKQYMDSNEVCNHELAIQLAKSGAERPKVVLNYALKEFKFLCEYMSMVLCQPGGEYEFANMVALMSANPNSLLRLMNTHYTPFTFPVEHKFDNGKQSFTVNIKFGMKATLEVKIEDDRKHKYYGCIYSDVEEGIILDVKEKKDAMNIFYEIEEFMENKLL